MATDQLMAPLPHTILPPGAKVTFEAIDPTTGLAVAGVKVQAIAISGVNYAVGGGGELIPGAFMYVPGPDS